MRGSRIDFSKNVARTKMKIPDCLQFEVKGALHSVLLFKFENGILLAIHSEHFLDHMINALNYCSKC